MMQRADLFDQIIKTTSVLLPSPDVTVGDIAKRYGVSQQTLYKNMDMRTYQVIGKAKKAV